VRDAHLERALGAAELLEGEQYRRAIVQRVELFPARARLAERLRGDAGERDGRGVAGRIDRRHGLAPAAAGARPDQLHPEARARAAPRSCSRASSTAARSYSASSCPQRAPGLPSGSAATPVNVMAAVLRVGSIDGRGSRSTPRAPASTRYIPRPASSRASTTST